MGPREWQWRRLGILPITSVMNYTTKRGYRIAMQQNTQQMPLDAELEQEGYNSKARARFFNRIWHPYLPRKISAMQWLILTKGLPVGEWRERIGMSSSCELCSSPIKETLQHALKDCTHLSWAWELFRQTRQIAHLSPAYTSWVDISRGLMCDIPGLHVDEELRWDTASAFSLNEETPWDILRAQLLWSIWCQRVAHTFRDENFHLGVVLWHAWRNTVYCALEAYKELFRHKRNEEKRQEVIFCFQQIWTTENIFGRLQGDTIKWNITPHQEFLPRDLGAWTVPPIRINRLSPSPDLEAEFVARLDSTDLVEEFLQNAGDQWHPPSTLASEDEPLHDTSPEESIQHVTPLCSQETNDQQEEDAHYQFAEQGIGTGDDILDQLHKESITTQHNLSDISYSKVDIEQGGYSPSSGLKRGSTSKQVSEEFNHAGRAFEINMEQLISKDATEAGKSVGSSKKSNSMNPVADILHKLSETRKTDKEKFNGRPLSRPKKRCTKKLHHPSRKTRRKCYSPVTEYIDTSLGRRNSSNDNGLINRKTTSPIRDLECRTPKSRSKRKCRFGPRARRALGKTQDLSYSSPLHLTGHMIQVKEDLSSLPHTDILSPPIEEHTTDFINSRTPPARVTLQPASCSRRTPFDSYFTSVDRAQVVDSSKLAAKRLGILESEFKASLNREINELLHEIEVSRRAALLCLNIGHECSD